MSFSQEIQLYRIISKWCAETNTKDFSFGNVGLCLSVFLISYSYSCWQQLLAHHSNLSSIKSSIKLIHCTVYQPQGFTHMSPDCYFSHRGNECFRPCLDSSDLSKWSYIIPCCFLTNHSLSTFLFARSILFNSLTACNLWSAFTVLPPLCTLLQPVQPYVTKLSNYPSD